MLQLLKKPGIRLRGTETQTQRSRPVLGVSAHSSRRLHLLGAGLFVTFGNWGLQISPARADFAIPEAPKIKYAIQENPAVKPALTVPEYVRRIETAQPAAFMLFTELAEVNRFKDISDDLNIDPFDTIVQSVYYLPWALLKVDPAGAQDCYDASVEFLTSVKDFDRLCLQATRSPDVDEEQVVAGLKNLLDVKLEKVLSTIRVA